METVITTLLLMLAIYFFLAMVLHAHYQKQWGPVCTECGANAGMQALVWPLRVVDVDAVEARCEMCGTMAAGPFAPPVD